MPATLNLQFPISDFTVDAIATPVLAPVLTPASMPSGEFADLLRLRVDTAPSDGENPGEWLPPGGTHLPLQALPVELEALPGLETGDNPMPASESLLEAEATDLALDLPLRYALTPGADARDLSIDPEVTVPAPAVAVPERAVGVGAKVLSTDLDAIAPAPVFPTPERATRAAAAGDVLRGPAAMPLPPPVRQIQQVEAPVVDKIVPSTGDPREHPLPAKPQPLPKPMDLEADENMSRVELPRRVEAMLPTATSSEDVSEIFKARPTVTQPVQVLNTQPNPQQPLVTTLPAAPTVSLDTGYSAAAQQATDLILTPVKDAAWGEQIGERVLLMAGRQVRTAEIRLTPAELGPLRVQVSVEDGAANVTFHVQHSVTREAIEYALPRLRELLAENGLSLGETSVGEQGAGEFSRDEHTGTMRSDGDVNDALEAGGPGEAITQPGSASTNSLVDTFV